MTDQNDLEYEKYKSNQKKIIMTEEFLNILLDIVCGNEDGFNK